MTQPFPVIPSSSRLTRVFALHFPTPIPCTVDIALVSATLLVLYTKGSMQTVITVEFNWWIMVSVFTVFSSFLHCLPPSVLVLHYHRTPLDGPLQERGSFVY
ncbi:hypothetical protein BJV74DRAFT_829517, partial [Russula compacta]